MAFVDLYQNPDQLKLAKGLVEDLEYQIRIVKAFEETKDALARDKLSGTRLTHCNVLAEHLNEGTGFFSELSKLTSVELMFFSLCFPKRIIPLIIPSFKAKQLQSYMRSQTIRHDQWEKVSTRFRFLAKESSIFATLWDLCQKNGLGHCLTLDLPPSTEAGKPNSFTFENAGWRKLSGVIPEPTLDSFAHDHPDLTEDIRMRMPRYGGDGIMTLELNQLPQLKSLFSGFGFGLSMDDIKEDLGSEVVEEIDKSELRQWEQKHGYGNYTTCVKVVPAIKVRVRSRTSLLRSI